MGPTLSRTELAPAVQQEHRQLRLLPGDSRGSLSLEGLERRDDETRDRSDEEIWIDVGDGFHSGLELL